MLGFGRITSTSGVISRACGISTESCCAYTAPPTRERRGAIRQVFVRETYQQAGPALQAAFGVESAGTSSHDTLMDYLSLARKAIEIELTEAQSAAARLDAGFEKAVHLIKAAVENRGKVVVLGVG